MRNERRTSGSGRGDERPAAERRHGARRLLSPPGRHDQGDDAGGRRIHPPLPPAHRARRFPPHPPHRLPRQPPSHQEAGTLPRTARRTTARAASAAPLARPPARPHRPGHRHLPLLRWPDADLRRDTAAATAATSDVVRQLMTPIQSIPIRSVPPGTADPGGGQRVLDGASSRTGMAAQPRNRRQVVRLSAANTPEHPIIPAAAPAQARRTATSCALSTNSRRQQSP